MDTHLDAIQGSVEQRRALPGLDSAMHTCDGEWPSGKAPVFGTGIRGFESLLPSHYAYACIN